ncbi:MAG: cation:proton antiporter subunit C [Alphaproteobacteria bacterium]|nr:cation:proton antiporter subunit C [Alphaproteobacteria bacterium]
MFADHYPYWISIVLMMSGFYAVMASSNLIKKLIGLSLFQTSVLLFYVAAGKVAGGTTPIYRDGVEIVYSNPLPQVLMLTAIVVGVATLAVGLAIVVRIRGSYGSIEEDVLIERDKAQIKHSIDLPEKGEVNVD